MKYKLKNYWFISIPVNFRLSWGKMGYSRHIFLCLEDEKGKTGFGEGELYKTTFLQFLPYFKKQIDENNYIDSDDLDKFTIFEPALTFALDTAIRDLNGELSYLTKYNDITEEIFLEDNISKKVAKFLKNGTRYVKLKVGQNLHNDKNNVIRINDLARGKLKIKLDANRGYDVKDALEMGLLGKKNNVVLFEEPINSEFGELAKLRSEIDLPIMLDESIQTISDLKSAIAADCFDVLNVKLTRLGGISNAEEYVANCKKNKKKVSLGCSEELNIGMSAIINFANRVDNLYGVEGYGTDRLDFTLGRPNSYVQNLNDLSQRPGYFSYKSDQIRLIFLAKEFYGVWKTRLENAQLLIKKSYDSALFPKS